MEKIIEVDGAKYDFNTYPIYDAPMDPQLYYQVMMKRWKIFIL